MQERAGITQKFNIALTRTKEFFKKQKFLSFLLLNLVVCVLYFSLFDSTFESLDDYTMGIMIKSGHFYIPFLNYFLGFLVFLIQKVTFSLNAFVLVQIGCIVLAFTVISYSFAKMFKFRTGVLAFGVLNALFAPQLYLSINFTKTAGVIALSGIVYLESLIKEKKSGILQYILAGLLVILGGMFRVEALYITIVFYTLYCISKRVCEKKKFSLKKLITKDFYLVEHKHFFKGVLCTLLIGVIAFGGSGIIVQTNKDYKYYKEYNAERSALNDYDFPKYEQNKEEIDKLGLDFVDYCNVSIWVLDDNTYASLDNLKAINSFMDKSIINRSIDKAVDILYLVKTGNFKSLMQRLGDFDVVILLSIILLSVIFIVSCKKRNLFTFFALLFGYGILLFYLMVVGRVVYRAKFMLDIFFFILLLLSGLSAEKRDFAQRLLNIDSSLLKIQSQLLIGFAFIFAFSGTCSFMTATRKPTVRVEHNYFENVLNYTAENKDNDYVMLFWPDVGNTLKILNGDNLVVCNGWTIGSQQLKDFASEYDGNIYKKIVEDKNAYVVSFDENLFLTYADMIDKHYYNDGNKLIYEIVERVDHVMIAKFSLGE